MPAQTPHQINRLQLDIACSSQETAIATQSRLSILMQHQIPDLLEQVFNQCDRPNQIIRIDRLELDLGILSLDNWETQLHETLPSNFLQCLTDRLKPSSPNQASVEAIPIMMSHVELLEYFLQYGQLSWNAQRQDFTDLDQVVLTLVQVVKPRFGFLLKQVLQDPYSRDRLKFTLAPDTLNQLHHDYPDLDWHWLRLENQSPSNRPVQPDHLEPAAADHLPESALQFGLTTELRTPLSESVQLQLIQLQEFLQSGQRPSTSELADLADLDGLVLRLLTDEPVAFRQLLQSIISQPIARQRLWLSLSETTLSQILRTSLEITLEDWEILQYSVIEVMEHLQRSAIAVISKTEAKRFRFEAFLLQLLNVPAATLVDRFRNWLEYELSPSQFSSNAQWEDVRQIEIAALSAPSALQVGLRDCLWQHLSHLDQVFISVADSRRSSLLPTSPLQEASKPAIALHSAQALGTNQDSEQADLLRLDSEQLPSQIPIQEVIQRNPLKPEQIPTQQLQPLTDTMPRSDRSPPAIPEPREGDVWFVQNGGLVLLWTYLNRYFMALHLVENSQFVNSDCQMQAMHYLELLVRGPEEQWQEYDLTLNKVLCGFPLFMPIDPSFNRNADIVQEADQLLHNAIKHWTIIQNTSVNGFRHSFLQREGKLTHQATHWLLQVERTGYDVLLEHLPYPLGVIKLPWMARPLYVEW